MVFEYKLFTIEKVFTPCLPRQKKSLQIVDLQAFLFFCGLARIQTLNLLIRSEMLYSIELRNHYCGADGTRTRDPLRDRQVF